MKISCQMNISLDPDVISEVDRMMEADGIKKRSKWFRQLIQKELASRASTVAREQAPAHDRP